MPQPSEIYASFQLLLQAVKSLDITTWAEIEGRFLLACQQLDDDFLAGAVDKGIHRNAKGNAFHALVWQLLTNASGGSYIGKGDRLGMTMTHQCDMAYPDDRGWTKKERLTMKPVVVGEAKAMGMIPHLGNTKSGQWGRAVRQEIDKRVKEIGLASLDLKARWGQRTISIDRRERNRTVIGADPLYYAFFACRAATEHDAAVIEQKLTAITGIYIDRPAMFLYVARDPAHPTHYEKLPDVPGYTIDEVINLFVTRMAEHDRAEAAA